MEKEELLLGVEMGRLEIEPDKLNISRSCANPFTKNNFKKNNIPEIQVMLKETKCACSTLKKINNSRIIKKKHNKILKEPVLRLLKTCGNITNHVEVEDSQKSLSTNIPANDQFDPLNLCTLVRNCNQLKISSSTNEQRSMPISKYIKFSNQNASTQEHTEPRQQSSQAGSCSQQALNPPCDVTIDELASYFETLVHIPKKMSSMAEMIVTPKISIGIFLQVLLQNGPFTSDNRLNQLIFKRSKHSSNLSPDQSNEDFEVSYNQDLLDHDISDIHEEKKNPETEPEFEASQ